MPNFVEAFLFGLVDELGHSAAGGVGCRAAQVFVGHLFAGDGFDHVGAGDVHLAGAPDHEDEISDGRGIHRAAGRRADDHRYLGDDPRIHGVAQEDIAVGGQAGHALLYPSAAGVVQPDHGAAGFHREVQYLADFLAHGLGKGAAHHGEILGEGEDLAALHLPVAGDHGVAQNLAVGQAEVGGPVGDEGVKFLECPFVHEQVQALAGGELSPAVLLVYPVLAAALLGLLTHGVEGINLLVYLPFFCSHSPSHRVENRASTVRFQAHLSLVNRSRPVERGARSLDTANGDKMRPY